MQAGGDVRRRGEKPDYILGDAPFKFRRRRVSLELAPGIVDQARIAAQFQAFGRHFQLCGKIPHAFQPRLDDELTVILNRIRDPAAVGFQKFRLEQADGIAAGQAERLFDDDLVMPAPADGGDGRERVGERIHCHADFVFGAEPICS